MYTQNITGIILLSLCTKPENNMTFFDHFIDNIKQSPDRIVCIKNTFLSDQRQTLSVGAWIPSHGTPCISESSWYGPRMPLRVAPLSSDLLASLTI